MLTFTVCTLALAFVALTLLVRANDLNWGRKPPKDMTRRIATIRAIGLTVAGFSPWAIIGYDFFLRGVEPSPFQAMFYIGLMLVFYTTPHMPPWWKQMSHDTMPPVTEERRRERRDVFDRERDENP